MSCGRCYVTELRSRAAPRLDIFIEILLRDWVNKGKESQGLGSPGSPCSPKQPQRLCPSIYLPEDHRSSAVGQR
jgi:hypothetical protein